MGKTLQILLFATQILSSKNPAEAAIDWGIKQAAGTEKGNLIVQVVNPLIEDSKHLSTQDLTALVTAIAAIELAPHENTPA